MAEATTPRLPISVVSIWRLFLESQPRVSLFRLSSNSVSHLYAFVSVTLCLNWPEWILLFPTTAFDPWARPENTGQGYPAPSLCQACLGGPHIFPALFLERLGRRGRGTRRESCHSFLTLHCLALLSAGMREG